MSIGKDRCGLDDRASRHVGMLGTALGASAAFIAVSALPGYAVQSEEAEPFELDEDPDGFDDAPEGLEGAEHEDALEDMTEEGLYEYGYEADAGDEDSDTEANDADEDEESEEGDDDARASR